LNAVPIDQEGIGIEGLRVASQQLQQGHALVVFPEGQRTGNGAIQPLRPGIHLLIKRTLAPIVPIGIAGAFAAWPRHHALPLPAPLFLPASDRTLAVAIGQPLDAERIAKMPRDQALQELMKTLDGVQKQAERLRRKPSS
jgi:1-acyl-sn-glycerol-3-phosphate acyltransferase